MVGDKGREFWLWGAVDQHGVVTDETLQGRRDTATAIPYAVGVRILGTPMFAIAGIRRLVPPRYTIRAPPVIKLVVIIRVKFGLARSAGPTILARTSFESLDVRTGHPCTIANFWATNPSWKLVALA